MTVYLANAKGPEFAGGSALCPMVGDVGRHS